MHAPPIIPNEAGRLAALKTYRLVDETDDLGLSGIVELAAHLFDVPIALVSLVEADRQFFKARTGISVCETERNASFCAHALALDDIMVIPDAREDPRFSDNRLVTGEPFVRFYAGMPLRTPDGHALGTLCLIDRNAREGLSTTERSSLKTLARLVLDKFEIRKASLENFAMESRFSNIAATSPDGIICADCEGMIIFWNQASARMFGHDAKAVLGSSIDVIVPKRLRGDHFKEMAQITEGRSRLVGKTVELKAAHADGREFPIELSLSTWSNLGDIQFGAIIRDITDRRAVEDQMFELAHIDGLSQLPNRSVLLSRITEREKDANPFALMLLDLDGFKDINVTLGHHTGNAVIREVARRLNKCARPVDTVSRLGGDEFAILVPDYVDDAKLCELAERVLESVMAPIKVDDHYLTVTTSIGIAICPRDGSSPNAMLSAADLAMYQAKTDGKNCFRMFSSRLRQVAFNRRAYEGDVRRAITDGEFELFYQPQIALTDGSVAGFEALLRWRHPTQGLLSPAQFLNTIESGPFAAEIGLWVLNTACFQAVEFRRLSPRLTMGVNLFAAQFRSGQLAEEVLAVLKDSELPPEALELEITENIILRNDPASLKPLDILRRSGVGIAFDDFGTGYASLSLLKSYPITRIKIDKSFVENIGMDHANAAIVVAILGISRSLGLEVIAEGVENTSERDFLALHGCSNVQGYLYGKPMEASLAEEFIESFSIV